MRKSKIIAAVAAALFGPLAGALPAADAAVGDAAIIIFTANASVTNGICAPVVCGTNGANGNGFVFDTEDPVGGIGVPPVVPRQRLCDGIGRTAGGTVLVGVRLNGGTVVSTPNAAATTSACRIRTAGTVNTAPVTGALGMSGGFCGSSSGAGNTTIAEIGGVQTGATGATVAWPQSAGTVIVGTVLGGTGNVVGAFAVQTTGAAPGTCGVVNGATTSFAVTGIAAGMGT